MKKNMAEKGPQGVAIFSRRWLEEQEPRLVGPSRCMELGKEKMASSLPSHPFSTCGLSACSVNYSWLNESTGYKQSAEVVGWLTQSCFSVLISTL